MSESCRCCHDCDHDFTHDHSHEHTNVEKNQIIILSVSAVCFAAALFVPFPAVLQTLLYLAVYFAAGWEVLRLAVRNIMKGKIFDENFLMATASLGAFCIGELPEGVAVMLFYQMGELFQNLAVRRSRSSIQKLMDIRPDRASRITSDGIIECDARGIIPGDMILVKAGERVPLDGVVEEGESQLDTSALTGESMPRDISKGNEVLAGYVNLSGTLTVEVSKPFGETTAAKILELVEYAGENKAPAEQFITKFARYYTPAVLSIAVLIAFLPPLLMGGEWSSYIHRALVFLVISCPCALVLSVPMGFFAGIGCASKNGILVKGGNYLEALCDAQIVVFDKTGTLTHGKFQVTSVQPESMDMETLMEYAAHAEAYSNHPIASCIRDAYYGKLDLNRISENTEQAGNGVKTLVDGKTIFAGNVRLMSSAGIKVPEFSKCDTPVYLAVDGIYAGAILIGDTPKEDAKEMLRTLKSMGIERTVMLTGDHRAAGESVGREVGVDEVHAELLPSDKALLIEQLLLNKIRKGKLLYIGDGINDAPALIRADVGIAMGGIGSDAAIEAADVVIMDDSLWRLPQAIQIARHTRKIVMQNIIFILLVKIIVLALGGAGYASMWEAVFADVGVSLLAVLNSMRALRAKTAH